MKENKSGNRNIPVLVVFAIGVVALLLLSLNSSSSKGESEVQTTEQYSSQTPSIQKGSVGGIPYLHCSPSSTHMKDLVLLHGAKFSKEDWRTSDILGKLCEQFSVTALDLNKSAGHNELKQVLDAMKQDSLSKIPVAIVTPSASGKTIVDWLGDIQEMKAYIGEWIPVATGIVARADENQLKQLGGLPILAIYGDKDEMGKRVSNTLGDLSEAKVIEIPGSHPCYLDSPDVFIQQIRKFLSK